MTPEDRIKDLRSDATPTEAEWLEFRSAAHQNLAHRRIAAVATVAAVLLTVVGGGYALSRSDDPRGPDVVGTPDSTETPNPTETETPEAPLDPVDQKLPMPLNQWYIETDGKLTPFAYFLYRPVTPRKLLQQTIEFIPGPLGETGGTTAIPEDNRLVYFQSDGSTATVVLRGNLPTEEKDLRMAQAQIVYTVTQFDGIDKVDLTWEGRESPGLTRKDFHELLPAIVVESPTDGLEVGRTFELSGIANVFEANVTWQITDTEGNSIREGFVTATCGSGCWGTYEERITLGHLDVPGDAVLLTVFQASAEDGSPMNMVRIPLNVGN